MIRILFTKEKCEKCWKLKHAYAPHLKYLKVSEIDVESQDGLVELCSLGLFGDAERMLPILVLGEKVAKGYIACRNILNEIPKEQICEACKNKDIKCVGCFYNSHFEPKEEDGSDT